MDKRVFRQRLFAAEGFVINLDEIIIHRLEAIQHFPLSRSNSLISENAPHIQVSARKKKNNKHALG
jgi:hypothetical protein